MLCPKCWQPYAGSWGVLAYLDNKYTLCYDFLDDYNALSKSTEEDTQQHTQSALNAFRNRIRVPPLRSSSTLPPPPPPISETSPHINAPSTTVEYHPRSSSIYRQGANAFERVQGDSFARRREANPHYPFQGREEWGLAHFLARSSLSQAEIDEFLKLEWVRRLVTFVEVNLKYLV